LNFEDMRNYHIFVTSHSPGRARSSPQQGCCHGHYQMTTRRCRSADSCLGLYHPSGYYRPCRPSSLIHALLVTYSHSKQQNRNTIFIRNHNNDHHCLLLTTDCRSTAAK
ncbi:hypothetical protein T05_3472, partial [Trichinella murrelli]